VLVQVLPLRVLAHPIWKSAETAIGCPVAGGIGVDPGASVIPLGQYLSVIAVAFLSAAAAVDHQRAERILFALTAAVTAIVVMLTHELFFPEVWLTTFARTQAFNCVGMGTNIASAACICTIERYETRRSSPQRSGPVLLRTFAACSAALAICGAAVMLDATREGAYCDGIRHPSTRVRGRQRSHKNVLSYRTQRAWNDAFSDIKLRDSISRKVHLLFTHQQKSAIVAAYNAASSGGRLFIEQTVREIDPSAVESLRARTRIIFRL
jgi:hypothetical protein